MLSLHLLNNLQQWGYHYSNLKVMTEIQDRGKNSSLKWEYHNSYHLGMPAGMSWSIIGQQAPSKLDSGWRFAEQVPPNSFAISGVWQPVLQTKPLEGKM